MPCLHCVESRMSLPSYNATMAESPPPERGPYWQQHDCQRMWTILYSGRRCFRAHSSNSGSTSGLSNALLSKERTKLSNPDQRLDHLHDSTSTLFYVDRMLLPSGRTVQDDVLLGYFRDHSDVGSDASVDQSDMGYDMPTQVRQ